ncbi:MAG TPA: glycosyltransferase [Actinomycetales bacterium]|nr:glycosyltransferase [Actinomycetales bacterium]
MRIAMVSEHASPLAALGGQDAGGQNVHVAALSTALARRGHDVVVYTRRDDPDLPERTPLDAGVEVVHVPAGPASAISKDDMLPFMPEMGRWLARDWRRHGVPDVVHAHFWMSGHATTVAVGELAEADDERPATAITFHALGVVKRRHQGAADTSPAERLGIERALLDRVDGVVATCRDEIAELLDLGADPRRLHVVPCGVDLERFTARGRHRVPWSDGCDRLLCLGRLVERKGIDTAVQALVDLPGAELVVAGGSDPSQLDDDPDVARLRAVARQAGVASRVRFIGRVEPDDAAALMRAADLVLTVPWYEPFGIVPLEAQACGTPVVATAVGGMLDTVVDGLTGAHVPARDPRALAARVRDLLAHEDRLWRMGSQGARRVAARYTWWQVAEETETVYERLLDPRSDDDESAPEVIDLRQPVRTGPLEGSPYPLRRHDSWETPGSPDEASSPGSRLQDDSGRKDS